jgi:hypothetical protein
MTFGQNFGAGDQRPADTNKTEMQHEAARVELPMFPDDSFEVNRFATDLDGRIQGIDDESLRDMLENDVARLSRSSRGWTEWFLKLFEQAKEYGVLPTNEKAPMVFAEPLQHQIKTMFVADAGEQIGNASYSRVLQRLGIPQSQLYTARLTKQNPR